MSTHTHRLDADDDLDLITGDPSQLRSAVSNLVDNALKYSPNGGEVHIKLYQQGNDLLLDVTDQGVGIASADLPHIFDIFYQGRGSNSNGGVGLGLALVHSIVKAHGGSVQVQSQKDVGTTFSLHLPVR